MAENGNPDVMVQVQALKRLPGRWEIESIRDKCVKFKEMKSDADEERNKIHSIPTTLPVIVHAARN